MAEVGAMTLYDELDYPGHAVRETHPDHIAGLAMLHGLTPPDVEHCRVLEIGCGDGTNLVPMAASLPTSRFTGIDLAARPLGRGSEMIQALGLQNVELRAIDLLDFCAEDRSFDFIIAHGLYSWVPAQVREQLLQLTGRMLADNGIAFISHLALPGSHLRNILRDAMRQHDDPTRSPAERIARAREVSHWIASAATGSDAFRAFAASLARELDDVADGALFHDYLAEHNEAVYIREFAARAAEHGLRYLCDAEFPSTRWEHDPSLQPARGLIEAAGRSSVLEREQLMDLLRCRRFRQTLLCRTDLDVREASPERLHRAALSSSLRPAEPDGTAPRFGRPADPRHDNTPVPRTVVTFRSPGGASLEIDHPAAIAALTALAECWPEALTWPDLVHQVESRCGTRDEAVVRNVLFACVGADFAWVHAASPRLVSRPGERPRASAVARYEITRRNIVTTLRHENLRIEDARGARLLQMLDGSRTRADLIRELSKGEDGNPDAGTLGAQLETALAGLARAAVLDA